MWRIFHEDVARRRTAGFIVRAGLPALFGLLVWKVFSVGGLVAFDQETCRAVHSWRTPERDDVARAVTLLGDRRLLGPATLVAAAVLVFAGRRVPVAVFTGSVLGGILLDTGSPTFWLVSCWGSSA